MPMNKRRGYTLIELIVAVGLFAFVMLLASGAYLLIIGINRQTQGIASGIDNLSFAVETMARDIRTGSNYNCGGLGDCPGGSGSFSFKDASGATVSYNLSSSAIQETIGGNPRLLTDSSSVTISSLTFYAVGTKSASNLPDDFLQPHVTIIISGTVTYGAGKTEAFTVETGATMRGTDL